MKNTVLFRDTYVITGVILFFLSTVITFYVRNSRLYYEPALSVEQTETLFLNKKTDLDGLTSKLDSLNWLEQKDEFYWAGRLLGWKHFKKGRYELTGQINFSSLFNKLGMGYQDELQVTVLPGLDLGRFNRRMAESFAFDSIRIAKVFDDSTYLSQDSLSRQQLFGRMLPETYRFYWTESPENVINKIKNHFHERVTVANKNRLNQIQFNLSEVVTLASIIEWEAHNEDEKPIISGLYWNRLDRGMRLQADPTVLYALGEKRRLYYKDYKINHPYNTYLHRGLPPGPITNPSLNSIKAALFPADHDYLYMVATPKGTHLFSETFSEHKRKSSNWRKWIREQYRLKRQRESSQQSQKSQD